MKITIPAIFLLLVTIFSTSIYAQNKISEVEGKWSHTDKILNRRSTIDLMPNGRFTFEKFLIADYNYKLNGKKMITSVKVEKTGKTRIDSSEITLNKDTLFIAFQKGRVKEKLKLVRLPHSKSEPEGIAGTYKWKYYTGDTAYSKFTKDGWWHFWMPVQYGEGNYKVKDDSLYLSFRGTKIPAAFGLKNNSIIYNDKGKLQVYKKESREE